MTRALTLALLLVVSLLTACTDKRTPEQMKDTLVYGFDDPFGGFDPAEQRMMKENAIMAQVLEGLTKWDNSLVIRPCLATSWETIGDCRGWRFHLRQNVQFHDNTPFDSAAVKAHFVRLMDPKTIATKAHLLKNVDRIETPDPMIVEFYLKEEDCVFPELLTGIFATIPSPTAMAASTPEKPFKYNPVGTGAFRFVSFDVATTDIVLEKNPDYWAADTIKLGRLEFRRVAENTTRLIMLEQGTFDMADVNYAQVNVAAKDSDIDLQTIPALAIRYIGFNNQKPPFNDVRVRRAANYAVNKADLVKYVFFGVGQPATGPLPSSMPVYNPDVSTYDYDPEKAKALLAEAGYPNGVDVVMWTQQTGQYRATTEFVVEYLRKVGIRVKLVVLDNSIYWKKFDDYLTPDGRRFPTGDGVFDMYVGGWFGGESAQESMEPLFRSDSFSNGGFYVNPKFDELVKQFKKTGDDAERARMLKEMQSILTEDAPWIFAYFGQTNIGMRGRVKGFKINPAGRYFFDGVSVTDSDPEVAK
ncbi:glutathione ABC transporter substrate-binding protein GsiB [soil metagenome]